MGSKNVGVRWALALWTVARLFPFVTRYYPISVIISNLVALGQTVWASAWVQKFGDNEARPLAIIFTTVY